MREFLSPEWLLELERSANASDAFARAAADMHLAIQQTVTGGPAGDITYVVRVDGGRVVVTTGPAPHDVAVTTDYPTALAVHCAESNAQQAFMQGRMKIAGDVGRLVVHQEALTALAAVLAQIS